MTPHIPLFSHDNNYGSDCIMKRFPISLVDFGSKFLRVGKIGKHLYVDPTTYQAMDDAVEDFANELNREDLHIGQLLGGGEFAEVYRGTLNKNFKKVDVAIKTLRVRSISDQLKVELIFFNVYCDFLVF